MTTTILGGGMSGLAAGYYLLRRFGEPITIYEASNRLGGWIRSERNNKEGFIFEVGPRTIRPKGVAGANTMEMIADMQMELNAITSEHVVSRNRMIYAKGQLCMLPNSLGGILQTKAPFTKPLLNALFNDLRTEKKKVKNGDESIYDFVERRFGTEVAQYAISPLICGICAGDAKEISVHFLMDELFEMEQKWGGVTKGIFLDKILGDRNDKEVQQGIFAEAMPPLFEKAKREKWSMYGIHNGLETLPRTVATYLRAEKSQIHISSECRMLIFTKDGVKMNIKGRTVETNHVISSLPSHKLAACVKDQHPSLAALLYSIPYVDVAVVNLQYNSKDILKHNAFGFLVPPIEQLPILGVIFDSCCFDMNGNTVLTVMMGGKWFQENFGNNPSQKKLLDTALLYLEQILGISQEPKMTRVHILQKCIPQYIVGHKQRVADIRRYIKNYKLSLSLCGAAYDGVGINDVILSARKQVEALQYPPSNSN